MKWLIGFLLAGAITANAVNLETQRQCGFVIGAGDYVLVVTIWPIFLGGLYLSSLKPKCAKLAPNARKTP